MKVLAVDPGEKRIGIAVSDPFGIIAAPLCILNHQSRSKDALRIIQIAEENACDLILIGQALQSDGEVGPRARSAMRLREVIGELSDIKTCLWDETDTTKQAHAARIVMGVSRKKRSEHIDDLAAAILLEDFLTSSVFQSFAENQL